jgi:hypothetical protein
VALCLGTLCSTADGTIAGVIHAIECQVSGHHQDTAAARDAVKKEALRTAGIGYHEVVAGYTTAGQLKRLVEKLMAVAD